MCMVKVVYIYARLPYKAWDNFASVPPDIAPPGDTQRAVLEGSNITLVCGSSVDGNPTPTISWTDNNGTAVSDGPEISGSNTLMLAITSVTHNQTGNWTCNVKNSVGIIDHLILLDVVGECMSNVVSRPHWQARDYSADLEYTCVYNTYLWLSKLATICSKFDC